ncbi:MAG: glutamine synthetase [Solirubrobacteraceae bacterium]|nr:glutamine synthetase [Solirubrobacteraceae bacterium]
MSDAWIYGNDGSEATSRMLAELGFSPHRVSANGTLRPPDGGSRAPALAVILAAGLRGIERGYELQAESLDDAADGLRLPLDLREATDLFDASELVRETLGDRLVDAYVANKRRETADERRTVTEFDRSRYLRLL